VISGDEQYLDPTSELSAVQRELAPRTDRLRGVVGLLDISKPQGDLFFDRLAELLVEWHPDIEVRRLRKPTFTKPAPDDVIEQAVVCDAVVLALAD
jgi:hypothetical protein